MRTWLYLATLGLLGWMETRAQLAHGQAALPTHARIVVVGCGEAVSERALLDQVRIELLSAGVVRVDSVQLYAEQEGEPDTFDVATLRIDFGPCQPQPSPLVLGIADRRTGKHTEQRLDLADIPDSARSRAIALSLVELLRGVWQTLTPVPVAAPEPERAVSQARGPLVSEGPPSEAEPKSGSRLEWMGMSRIYPQTDSGDLATSLSYSTVVGDHLRMRAGGTAAGGGGDGSNVHSFQGTGRFSLALCSTSKRPAIEVGTAWDVGWAQLRGNGNGRSSGFITIGTIEGILRVSAAKGIEALVSLQAGYVLMPVTIEMQINEKHTRTTGIDGSVLGVGIGLAGIL